MITFEQFYKEFLIENANTFSQYTFKIRDREAYLQNEKVKNALALLSNQEGLRILSLPNEFAFEKRLINNGYKVSEVIGLEANKEALSDAVKPAAEKLIKRRNGPKIYLRKTSINTQQLLRKFNNKIFVNVADDGDIKSASGLRPNIIDLDYVGMYIAERRAELLPYSELLEPGGLLFVTYAVRPTSSSGLTAVADLDMPVGNELREIEQVMPSQEVDVEELKTDLSNERKSKIGNIIISDDEFINKIKVLKTIIELLDTNERASATAGDKKLDLTKYTSFAINPDDKYKSIEIFYKVANSVKKTLNNFELIYANIYRGGRSISGTGMIRLILQKNNLNENYSNNITKQHLIYEGFSSESARKAWMNGEIKRIILTNWSEVEEKDIKYNNIIDALHAYAEEENISITEYILPFLRRLLQKAETLKSKKRSNAPADAAQQPVVPADAAQQPVVPADAAQQPVVPADAAQQPVVPDTNYEDCLKNEYNNYLIQLGLKFTTKKHERFALKVKEYINYLNQFKTSFVKNEKNRISFENIYDTEELKNSPFQVVESGTKIDIIRKMLEYIAQDKQTYLVFSYGRKANYSQNQSIIQISAIQIANKKLAQRMLNNYLTYIDNRRSGDIIINHELIEPKYIKTSLGEWIDANNYDEYLNKQDSAMSFDEFAIEAESGDVCNHYDE